MSCSFLWAVELVHWFKFRLHILLFVSIFLIHTMGLILAGPGRAAVPDT